MSKWADFGKCSCMVGIALCGWMRWLSSGRLRFWLAAAGSGGAGHGRICDMHTVEISVENFDGGRVWNDSHRLGPGCGWAWVWSRSWLGLVPAVFGSGPGRVWVWPRSWLGLAPVVFGSGPVRVWPRPCLGWLPQNPRRNFLAPDCCKPCSCW